MPKTPLKLPDLRRRRDAKAQAAPSWRFWGLSGHICHPDRLSAASQLAQAKNGAPGVAGVTFDASEASGLEALLEPRRHARVTRTYRPMRWRHKAIPQEGGQGPRLLSRPTSRARVVQGALTLFLEPLVAADCQPGAYG
jgi:RNA-directed DNA polymerase